MKAPFKRRTFGDENDKIVFALAFFGGIATIIFLRLLEISFLEQRDWLYGHFSHPYSNDYNWTLRHLHTNI